MCFICFTNWSVFLATMLLELFMQSSRQTIFYEFLGIQVLHRMVKLIVDIIFFLCNKIMLGTGP